MADEEPKPRRLLGAQLAGRLHRSTRGIRIGLVRRSEDVLRSLDAFSEAHISAVRRSRNGAITSVKHIFFGWMSPKDYYLLQKLEQVGPGLLIEFVQGGYRLKAALYTIAIPIDVLATGTDVPLGLGIVTIAVILAAIDSASGQPAAAALDLLSLVLPFGEIWLLYRGASLFSGAVGDLAKNPDQLLTELVQVTIPGLEPYIALDQAFTNIFNAVKGLL